MEKPPTQPETIDLIDSDDESVASTIQTDHGSDEEWLVSAVIAAWKLDGKLLYLIEWEGYDLYEATWEPKENLNDKLIIEWRQTKTREDFDLYQRIRDWKNAWKTKYDEKFTRHQERNRLRKHRGQEPTSFQHMEEWLAWVNKFPDGEEPSKSAASKSSGSAPDHHTDGGTGQQLQSFEKRKLSIASPSEDPSPNSSRRNSTASTHKQTLAQSSITESSTSHQQAPRRQSSSGSKGNGPLHQKPAATNSLLTSKFGRPKPLKRPDSETNKEQLTARKTQTASVFTGNVFSGGKTRKKRATLAEVAKDASKQPKLMKHRYARIIEKAGRDREGAAPTKMPSDLISLNPAERQMDSITVASPEAIEADENGSLNDSASHTQHDGHPPEVTEKPPKPPKPKLKKSISWGGVEETIIPNTEEPTSPGTSEPMVIDNWEDSIFIREDSLVSKVKKDDGSPVPTFQDSATESTPQTKTTSRRVRWAEDTPTTNIDTRPPTQTITKNVQFGPGTREVMLVDFERYSPQTEQAWPELLESEPMLVFTHTCMVHDFRDHENTLATEKFGNGSITSKGDPTSLTAAASWLHLRSLGVLFYHPELCVFMHASDQIQPTTISETPSLQYYLFRPAPHFTSQSLAPAAPPEGLANRDVMPQMTSTVFKRILGFQYQDLLPENAPLTPSKHHFFLAFPPNAGPEGQFVGKWLRTCNPECKILTSFFPGHWRSFLKLEQGVVILHEEVTWSIRLFPNVRSLLHSASNFQFRLFSKSLQSLSMYSPLDQPSSIGDVVLQSICGQRKALLVTPSFIVSQPQQVWNFFKWFYKGWHHSRDAIRLVVCAGFDTWLLGVAAEKENKWSSNYKNTQKKEEAYKEIEALYKTWGMARALIESSTEEQPAFIFAPQSIDGNDEQSLVNWFGWWTIMNMDQFRKFSVVGSSRKEPKRLSRRFTRPEFSSTTCANPDDVYGILDRADLSQNQLQEQSSTGQATQQLPKKLQLIHSDDAGSFRKFLKELDDRIQEGEWTPQKLFHFPVSYWNSDMAYDFGDYHNGFAVYNRCLQYLGEKVHTRGYYNTGIAFCYTIEETWKPGENSENLDKNRRPWIAIYRPVEPFKRPWQAAELLIWDPIRSGKLSEDAKVYEGDLIEAQRQMIQAARRELDEKLPLERVWVGGLDGRPDGLTDPVDITLHQVQRFMENLKATVPAPWHSMPLRGWRVVEPGTAPVGSRLPSPEPMDIDVASDISDTASTDEELRTVFHPPRGKQLKRPTLCKNRLFQHCTNEKIRGQDRRAMEYRFRPTMEWYGHQVAEGRGFEHIRVTTWEAVFEKYKIDDPKKD
ncbi:hypothetical protein FSARC_729 [Fusarium sarcochroum]|uniref:Chromo domain-containing protein n=1 Tax=Fusarium sarcochroum TaxID=1208366 RepID=A0A8H4XG41_9HYPO|nr:hypothetical protein FSARC_729 [Fusarium sarcochroum]